MDSGLNSLLKWSIENSANSAPQSADKEVSQVKERKGNINADALRALMGGPSDAQLMKESIAAIQSHDISLENKLLAFDNFEQLIEQIDNANNMQVLGLWTPLLGLLENEEAELRRCAAWCMGTAVQNNVKAQETLLVVGAVPVLVKVGIEDPVESVRRKAIYALSSEIRNYQPALDATLRTLPEEILVKSRGMGRKLDAGDMEAVDLIIDELKRRSQELEIRSGGVHFAKSP